MNFSQALEEIKKGSKLTRNAYQNPGMFIYLVQGSEFEVNRPPLNAMFPMGKKISYRPHIDLCMEGETIACGTWHPSMGDILAEDWEIVTEPQRQPAE